jgi:hypothetical protein
MKKMLMAGVLAAVGSLLSGCTIISCEEDHVVRPPCVIYEYGYEPPCVVEVVPVPPCPPRPYWHGYYYHGYGRRW